MLTKTHRRDQNYLPVLEGLLQRCGSAGAHHRDRGVGRSPLVQALLEGTMVEITVTEQNIEKRMKRNADSLRDL